MSLYLGNSEKLKVNLNSVIYIFKSFSENPITNGIRLLSSDNYTLKDFNGIYLTVKEGD